MNTDEQPKPERTYKLTELDRLACNYRGRIAWLQKEVNDLKAKVQFIEELEQEASRLPVGATDTTQPGADGAGGSG